MISHVYGNFYEFNMSKGLSAKVMSAANEKFFINTIWIMINNKLVLKKQTPAFIKQFCCVL